MRTFFFARCLLLSGIFFSFVAHAQDASSQTRQRLNFNADWLFHLGDPSDVKGDEIDYPKIKDFILASANEFTKGTPTVRPEGNPGGDVSFVKPDFDDSGWQKLNLPHDWAIAGPFNKNLEGSTGKLPWVGKGWYRKHFNVPAGDQGRHLFLGIDGAMAYSTVWVNGQLVGGWPYGYSSYELELTPYLKFGGDNVISIRLNNLPDSSRWYPGSGIYRNVWLVKTGPVHISHWGTTITTPDATAESATIHLSSTVLNQATSPMAVQLATVIYDLTTAGKSAGPVLARLPVSSATIPAGGRKEFQGETSLTNPKLWTLEDPHRYGAVTAVIANGRVVDRYETPFGIRTIHFDPKIGFLLNGVHVPIRGVCDHHDLGALGAAFNTRAAERQLQILKEMGCNALRTSHNMPAPELLDLCDRMGILVMDESFDCWEQGKRNNDYHLLFADWHERDQRAEYRRDRNHPSVIMWSIGNEVLELNGPRQEPIAAGMTAIAHDEDPTRPTVLGSNCGGGAWGGDPGKGIKGVADGVDIYGQNYYIGEYASFTKARPDQPMIGSETASCVSSRGVYSFPYTTTAAENSQVSDYDLAHPGWGCPPDDEFAALEKNPTVAGEFVWSGFDYLGEPTPVDSSRSSYFGIVDLCGFKKNRFYLYQAHWRPDLPMVHILPHWNWPDRVGKVTAVHVFTSGDEVELFLNGTSLGRKKKEPLHYRIEWDDVVYAPGELKAVAYKDGRPWAQETVRTTGDAAAVQMKADRPVIKNDGVDLCYVTTTLVDKTGLVVPVAQNNVTYEITSGPGEIVATDNGDPTDLEAFPSHERHAFNGMALAIVRTQPGQSGDIHLRASSSGLQSADLTIRSAP